MISNTGLDYMLMHACDLYYFFLEKVTGFRFFLEKLLQ